MTVMMDGLVVRELVVRELAKAESADPHEVARAVVQSLSEVELRAALVEVLPDYVREAIRALRRHPPGAPSESVRWNRAAADHRQALLNGQWCAGGRWKFMHDLTVPDLRMIEVAYEKQAAAQLAMRDRIRAVRELLAVQGVEVVGAIPDAEERLAEIFNA